MRPRTLLVMAPLLGGCTMLNTADRSLPSTAQQAIIPAKTTTQRMLNDIAPPPRPIAIAVYGFTDQTGQFKPSEVGQTLSRAVSQGGGSILVKALHDAGNRRWFTVVEREQLKNLLSERQIIREMRERYLGESAINADALPSLLFAGVLLEGGVIGYDSNTVTGGAGAAFLGLGARTEYRQDTVTVYLRAVSVRTGEVLASVSSSKTIASRAISASTFKFVAFKELLEAELGITSNEPDQLALQQAIEKAVFGLIMEGIDLKLWAFASPDAGAEQLDRYHCERDGGYSPQQVQAAIDGAARLPPLQVHRKASLDPIPPPPTVRSTL
ncbi:CsgG/HfaB family protein [Sphingomonas carotinifaciens]|uniref:CsgG/HfaB family protein n=1 Tax=Sphingomonas carotinifaciens TaxID=1166323 RepID=UPI0039A3DA89